MSRVVCAVVGRTCVLLLLLWPALARGADPSEPSREAGTGGLLFVNDASIRLESQDLVIGRDEITVTYLLRNVAAAERSLLVSFPFPDIDAAVIGDQPLKLGAPQSTNFLAANVMADGGVVPIAFEQRARVLGLDVTDLLISLKLPLFPYDQAMPDLLRRLPKATRTDLAVRGVLRPEDDRLEPNWTLKTTAFWRQSLAPRHPLSLMLTYKPVRATSAFQPALIDALKSSHCIDGSVEAAITRKVAAQGGQVVFNWLSYVPGGVSGGNAAPARQFRLRLEKPAIETVVATCRKDLRQLGPTAYEWSAADFHLEEDVHVLFID